MIYARVNHGRWVVSCGTPYCASAQLADGLAGDRFYCDECSQQYDVVFPDDRAEIDRVLGRRKYPQTRNWVPGETVGVLELENAAHRSEGAIV